MNGTLTKAAIAGVPVCLLFFYSVLAFRRDKTLGPFLQLLGATCLAVVIIAHVCEGLRLFPWMGWGTKRSAGRYLDLVSAIAGLTAFPSGYLFQTLARKHAGRRSFGGR